MTKKIKYTILTLVIGALVLPVTSMAATALPNLKVNYSDHVRNFQFNYTFTWQIRNTGPDNLVNATFADAAGFKENNVWYRVPGSILWHYNYNLAAGSNSGYWSWTGDTPNGFYWYCQSTDEFKNVSEADETDNLLLHYWYFY